MALARAVSLVENQREGFEQLLTTLHPRIGRARRIGVTGPPGAGKSTLTTGLINEFRREGLKVGVIAVDPTSPFTGGALLGDRVRMESVALDPGVFIRSLATRGSLGGISSATRSVADVLDAFGFDRIIMETVGVGQSELDIARAADTTIVVLVPESGDSIQALKAGLMEIADLFVVNKADRPGAERVRNDIEMMLGIDASSIHVIADNGAPVDDAMVAWAQDLQPGTWYTLDHNGASAQVQYAWQSQRKQLHLFAAVDGSSYLIQLRRLAAYLQAGLLVAQDEEGLTLRATRDALAKLDANPERLLD